MPLSFTQVVGPKKVKVPRLPNTMAVSILPHKMVVSILKLQDDSFKVLLLVQLAQGENSGKTWLRLSLTGMLSIKESAGKTMVIPPS